MWRRTWRNGTARRWNVHWARRGRCDKYSLRFPPAFRRRGPRPLNFVSSPEFRDPLSVVFGEINIIPAIDKLVTADGVNIECVGPIAADDNLLNQVYEDRPLWIAGDHRRNFGNVALGNDGRQQTVLDGVLCKDVTERRRDDASKAMIAQCIDGGLTRRTTAEVASRQ